MLALTRKKGESLIVGNDIEIMVVDISPGQVKLSIKAPRSVAIHRKEIYDTVKEQMKVALQSDLPKTKMPSLSRLPKVKKEAKGLFKKP